MSGFYSGVFAFRLEPAAPSSAVSPQEVTEVGFLNHKRVALLGTQCLFREGLSQDCGCSCSFSGFLLSSWFPSQTLVSLCFCGSRLSCSLSGVREVLRCSRRISILHGAVCVVLEIAVRSPRGVVTPGSWWSTVDEDSSAGSLEM